MITGFNTDIEFEGVTYHIQTEDKGLATPEILSLVYNKGTILARKSAPYNDLLEHGFDEKLLSERLQKQHKTICAAVKKGRIAELSSLKSRSAKGKKKQGVKEVAVAELTIPDDILNLDIDETIPAIPMPKLPPISKRQPVKEAPINFASPFEDLAVIPIEAVKVVGNLAGTERPGNNNLGLEILGDSEFRGGSECSMTVLVCRGSQRRIVAGAEIMVKVLGSSFRPLIFHSRTDSNGVSSLSFKIPSFSTGRAGITVRAINDGEEVEIRRTLAHG